MLNHFFLNNFDQGIAVWFLDHRNNFGIHFFEFVSFFGNWQFLLPAMILFLLWLYSKKQYKFILPFLLTVGSAEAVTLLGKVFFHRPRPSLAVLAETDFSFPSGHATIAVALYGYLAYLLIKTLAPKYKNLISASAVLLAALIGFSRIYLGVHFLSDVLVGYLIGGVALIVGTKITEIKNFFIFLKSRRVKILLFCLVIIILSATVEFLLWQKKVATTKMIKDSNTVAVIKTTSPLATSSTATGTVEYRNTQYGFYITLPGTWSGYTVVNSIWEGQGLVNGLGSIVVASGPIISIRNPKWTKDKPYQDIPVMIYTLEQWNDLQSEKFSVGAAPIPPSELGRNIKYVFALPARYNFAFPEGFEEVDKIIKGKPLQGF
ncbi:MAG: phosphatase PAP2 family protein [Candidatus Falkowbacteria bacterium]